MRHQLPRPEISQGSSAGSSGASTSTSSNLPGTSTPPPPTSGVVVQSPTPMSNLASASSPNSTPPPAMGPPPPTLASATPPNHSVIRTLRQKSMVENSAEVRRSSYASASSASTTALLANLEAAHSAEMSSVDNPATIVRHVVSEMGSIIQEMRAEQGLDKVGTDGFLDVANCSDVDVLRQRLIKTERANHMMTIHLDLMALQTRLETAEAAKLDDRKTFILTTREELYKEIVELLEAEFSCSICNEVFVSPCVTKCGHTFCELCIKTWTRDKVDCPICRAMIFSDWGKNCEIDNFITRLHLRLSDEIRQSREALVQERVQAVETLRTTPRRNEGAAFVDALRFLRDQQQQGRTTPTTARALAERFRAMRRSAAEANLGNIEEVGVAPPSPATSPGPVIITSNDGPTARIRARLQQELDAIRQTRQQDLETLNRISPLSRAGSSSGRQSSPSSSVARIRVRPSQGVSFTLVAPRSIISSSSQPTASSPTVPMSVPSQTMMVRVGEQSSSGTSGSNRGNGRQITATATVTAASTNEEQGRRVPNRVIMGSARAYSLRSYGAARTGLDRASAVAHARSPTASRAPSDSQSSTSSAVVVSSALSTRANNSRNDESPEVDNDDDDAGANAARRIRSIFSNATASSSRPVPGERMRSMFGTIRPYNPRAQYNHNHCQDAANANNQNEPARCSMVSRLSGAGGTETNTTVSSSGRPISSTINTSGGERAPSDDNSQQQEEQSSSLGSLLSPVRNASSEILRAFSERENLGGGGPSRNIINLEDDSAISAVSLSPSEMNLERLDQQLRDGEVTLRDAISTFRERWERVMTDSGLGLVDGTPPPRPATSTQHLEDMEDMLAIAPYDVEEIEDVEMAFPSRTRGSAASATTADTRDAQSGDVGNRNCNLNTAPAVLNFEDENLDDNHSSLELPPIPRVIHQERPTERAERRILHRLRESRRRRGDRSHHREGSGSRGRETTITISFCRGDQEANRNNANVGSGDSQSVNESVNRPPTPPPAVRAIRTLTPIVNTAVPANPPLPLPIVMDMDSDSGDISSGPSTSTLDRGDLRNGNVDSTLTNETQITGNSSSAPSVSDYNNPAQPVDEDIEILFSDIEDGADAN